MIRFVTKKMWKYIYTVANLKGRLRNSNMKYILCF